MNCMSDMQYAEKKQISGGECLFQTVPTGSHREHALLLLFGYLKRGCREVQDIPSEMCPLGIEANYRTRRHPLPKDG